MNLAVALFIFLAFKSYLCIEFKVSGPGLFPDKIVLPARYFFVESDSNAPLENLISVEITGKSQSKTSLPCRTWVTKLDRKDGSLIIRYRLYETCYDLKISLLHKNKHIGESPYQFKGPILPEECHCPAPNFDAWSQTYGCPFQIPQLESDMKPFSSTNMTLEWKRVVEHLNHPGSVSLCLYRIEDNLLFRKCYGNHVGFHIFSDDILLSVLRKVSVPDQAFFVNLGDWPLAKKSFSPPLPIFSWCGSSETDDIVLPTYDLTESTLENMGRVMLDMLSVQGNIEKSWDEKIPMAFWRGRDSREERLRLIDIARQNPALFNASLTNFFFYRDKEKEYGPKEPHVSFYKFFDYKYQINMDGTVAAYRFPYLLAGDSLVLKQESPYYEHFYADLEPYEHYVPFKRDLSDLTEKIKWAMDNDEAAKRMAKNGREFANRFLLPKDIICYYAVALNEWSKRIVKPVTFPKELEMELVPQKQEQSHKCHCNIKHSKDEL